MLMQHSQNNTALPQAKLAKRRWVRWLCIFLSIIFLILGTAGIVIPGLPTVDFYILASLCAMRGSTRLHRWITHNRFIAPILRQWHECRTLPLKVKILSLCSMTLAAIIMSMTIPHPYFVGFMVACMVGVQVWMWTRL